MKVKTSITLSEELIAVIDLYLTQYKTRSQFVEAAVQSFVRQLRKAERDAHDIAIINKNATRLNREMADVLSYQAEI
jgi:metal-responsive CopG/Arc/MetJ family transcriptional regulator